MGRTYSMSSLEAERSVAEVSMHKALAVLSLALLAGCNDTLVPTTTDPLGTWAANFDVVGSSLILTLDQTYGSITGAGSYAIEAGRAGTVRIRGSYSPPAIAIELFYDFGQVLSFSGRFEDADHLKGFLANSQGQQSPLAFTRR
jgi:hypothetical protein